MAASPEEDETLPNDFINLDEFDSSTNISLDSSEEEVACKRTPTMAYSPRGYFPQLTHLFSATIRSLSAEFGGVPQTPLLYIGSNRLALTQPHSDPWVSRIYLSFTMYYKKGIFGPSVQLPCEVHMVAVKSDHTHACFTMHEETEHTMETCNNIDTNKQVVLLAQGADECFEFLEARKELLQRYHMVGWTVWALKSMCLCAHAAEKSGFEVATMYEYIACLINEFLPADNKLPRENCRTVQQLYDSIGRFRTIVQPPLQ